MTVASSLITHTEGSCVPGILPGRGKDKNPNVIQIVLETPDALLVSSA